MQKRSGHSGGQKSRELLSVRTYAQTVAASHTHYWSHAHTRKKLALQLSIMLVRCRGFTRTLPLLLRLSFVSTAMGNQASTKGDGPVYNINEVPQPKVKRRCNFVAVNFMFFPQGLTKFNDVQPLIPHLCRLHLRRKNSVLG